MELVFYPITETEIAVRSDMGANVGSMVVITSFVGAAVSDVWTWSPPGWQIFLDQREIRQIHEKLKELNRDKLPK